MLRLNYALWIYDEKISFYVSHIRRTKNKGGLVFHFEILHLTHNGLQDDI